MTIAAIIVAAGRGERAGGDVAKQWRHIAGRMVVQHAIDAFVTTPGIDVVVVVLNPSDLKYRDGLEARKHLGWYMDGAGTDRSLRRQVLTAVAPADVLSQLPDALCIQGQVAA